MQLLRMFVYSTCAYCFTVRLLRTYQLYNLALVTLIAHTQKKRWSK